MPKIQRAISIDLHEWDEWADYAEKMRMSISELIRQSVRGHIGCTHPSLPGCIVSEIDAIAEQLEKAKGSIERMKTQQTIIETEQKVKPSIDAEDNKKMDKYDRLFADIKSGKFRFYNADQIYEEYNIDAHASGNIWNRATKNRE